MPELPDLEVVREFLRSALANAVITGVEVRRPIVVRNLLGTPPGVVLVGRRVHDVNRLGKFLWIGLDNGSSLVINPKLAGRLHWRAAGLPLPAYTALAVCFSSGHMLLYVDSKDMGQVYITDSPSRVPGFREQGPDALDPALTAGVFAERLRRFRGEIKGILTRQDLVAGIGNAYADEILFRAGVSPFRKRPQLSEAEVSCLYDSMRTVLEEAIDALRRSVGEGIEVEVRDFMQVHGRGGMPCPRCGRRISELRARQRITNYCRGCQPGTLIRN